jgi:hypothetical protein
MPAAERMLKEHPLIDSNSVSVEVNDLGQIVVNFGLVDDSKIDKYLMK